MEKHSVKVGDLFQCGWGYDQTNRDFYQVVEVKPASVIVRPIGSERIDDNSVKAVKDAWKGEPMLKRVNNSGKLKMDYCFASEAEWGKGYYETPWYAGH